MSLSANSQEKTFTQVGSWTDVCSFSINRAEDYIVFSQQAKDQANETAYEAFYDGSSWGNARPITALNECFAGGSVGGLFLTDDGRRLYFHAKKADSSTGYDLYYSDLLNDEWTAPKKIETLSTEGDDTYPSVIDGEELIYYLRHQAVSDVKQEKKEGDKMTIYAATKNAEGEWGLAEPINPAVSSGYVQDARVAQDGLSFHYSMKKARRDKALLYFSRRSLSDSWLLPETIFADESFDYYCPQITDKNIYFVAGEKTRAGKIYMGPIPNAKFGNTAIVTEDGFVTSKATGKPVVADIVVKDPTSNGIIGRYTSKADDGYYSIVNRDKNNYFVEVRSPGYSYASYNLRYDGSGRSLMPEIIQLFDTISLSVAIFDAEIFRPVEGTVKAVRQENNASYQSAPTNDGTYELRLPIGSDYDIICSGNGFDDNQFVFRCAGDIVFDHFDRELAMQPKKRKMTVNVVESESKEDVQAQVVFKNLTRDEVIEKGLDDKTVDLRDADSYDVTVQPVRGYAFKHLEIDLTSDKSTELNIEVLSLKPGASLQLNDILFESGSAFLMTEAYPELDRVVTLMNENPDLVVEISAHTDNVGKADYNLKLSDRRAASVVEYLTENGIDVSRLQPKGYGLTKPIAPNDTEENRAKNRRVMFTVVGQL